ncbi:MAG: hypothetical protein R3E32_05650 [Chitinophagales bacterium]
MNGRTRYTDATITGLTAGIYTVTVTDAHNCTDTAEATVSEPDQLTINLVGVDILCSVKTQAKSPAAAQAA